MHASRVDRFQTASRDDLSALEDKVEPEAGNDMIDPSEPVQEQTDEDHIGAFQNLSIQDPGPPPEYEDSEDGYDIEIEAVEPEDKNPPPLDEIHAANKPSSLHHSHGAVMQRGQLTTHGQSWCPVIPLSKFPYEFVPKASRQAVASALFDGGKFWMRGWDLFYVWPADHDEKPIILVREEQFCALLHDIDARFPRLNVSSSERYLRDIMLVIGTFPDHPSTLPRYLGHCKSRQDYDVLVSLTPSPIDKRYPGGNVPKDAQAALFALRGIVDALNELNSRYKKGSKEKRQEQRIVRETGVVKLLGRAQQYLGLATSCAIQPSATVQHQDETSEIAEHEDKVQVDVAAPVPYAFKDEPVIICVDVEAWEESRNIITEVGFATLDVRELQNIAPGEGGKNWRPLIRARHLRIAEHMDYNNSRWVQGNAEGFEFGQSEIVEHGAIAATIAQCFREPFSRPRTQAEIDESWSKSHDARSETEQEKDSPKRNIILLGHNPSADITYLKKLSYNPLNLSNLLETIDTADLFRAYAKEQNPRSLGNILAEFGILAHNLHNAGNDAVYTLWIMIATCIKEAMKSHHLADDDEKKS